MIAETRMGPPLLQAGAALRSGPVSFRDAAAVGLETLQQTQFAGGATAVLVHETIAPQTDEAFERGHHAASDHLYP